MSQPLPPSLRDTCRLRPASEQDKALLWTWANDPAMRRYAFEDQPIPWERHCEWFAKKQADPACLIAILEPSDGTPLGQVRFELEDAGLEIDISVSPELRGQGLGRLLLRRGMELAASRWPRGTLVVAHVLLGNEASARLFQGSGFSAAGTGIRDGKRYVRYEARL